MPTQPEQSSTEYRVRWEDGHCMYPRDDLSSVEKLIAWRARFAVVPVAAVERREVGPWQSVYVHEGEMTTEEDVRRDTITRSRK